MNESEKPVSSNFLTVASAGFLLFKLILHLGGQNTAKQALAVVGLCAVLPAVLVLTCASENTLRLHSLNGGRGLFEHYGTWSLAVSCPLIILILINILTKAEKSFARIAASASAESADEIKAHYERLNEILRCRQTEHRVCFYLLVIVGLFSLVVNLQNTRQSIAIYGHEVWDSSTYFLGYAVGKIFVTALFMYVFPIVVYIGSAVWFSILAISTKAFVKKSIPASPYHPDKCGGFHHLGVTALAVTQLSFPFVFVVIGHYYTHQSFYETLILACVIVTFATFALLYFPFVELHKHLKTIKERQLTELQAVIEAETAQFVQDRKLAKRNSSYARQLSILASSTLYSQTERLNTWPYVASDHIRLVSILVPPVVAFVLKRIFG